MTKAMNLMHLKTIKYACIYALKSDKIHICIQICSKILKICKKTTKI